MPDDEARERFIDTIEAAILEYTRLEHGVTMPTIEDWALVATIDDVEDWDNGEWVYLRGRRQSTHRTVGLLTMMSDHIRDIVKED